jgi:branched-chain amino acid transport system substrate-binding protein
VRRSALSKVLVPVMALSLVAASCGDDDDDSADPTTEPAGTDAAPGTSAAPEGTEGTTAETTAGSAPEETTEGGGGGASGAVPPGGDSSADLGAFTLGVINSNDLFPDYAAGIEAAVEYANEELNGLEGRPIELQICTIDYNTPDDTQRCANELAAAEVDFAVSTLNQFGTHMQILRGAGIPVLVGTAVSVPDYTTEGVYSISPGGGCAGTLTALAKYAVQELGAMRVAVPYYDIPSGVLCYADSEQKPLDVLTGTVEGATSADSGSVPDLERLGIPVPPTDPDLTSVANQILEFDPDAIIFSAPATSCFPLLAALNSVGYSVEEIPFLMSTSCFDQQAAEDAGENGVGLYFVGSAGYLTRDPADLEGAQAEEATLYQEKATEYGLEEFLTRNFAQQGFTLIMSMVQRAAEVAAADGQVDGTALADAFAATEDAPQFGSSPISCASAPPPYIAVCNRNVNITQWDGSEQQPVLEDYYAMDLLDGTEIRTEPID